MTEFLLEIRSGDLPAGHPGPAARRLKEALVDELRRRGMPPKQSGIGHTPRRLILMLRGDVEQNGGEKGGGLRAVLEEVVPDVAARLKWPRAPSWNRFESWPRPVTGVLALLDGEPLEMTVLGVRASTETSGHPFLSPESFEVESTIDFARKLKSRGIELRPGERRRHIEERVEELAGEIDGRPVWPEGLLERLADGVEIPGVVRGGIDARLLDLPRELVTACLEIRRGAVCVERDGRLLPQFFAVMDRPDDPSGRVQRGAEVAVRSALEELRELWRKDLATPLAERYRALEQAEYGDGLGSWHDKATRIADLAETLCRETGLPSEASLAGEAARLLKADLESAVVSELPRLAGVVGGLLAREEGYPESVWQTIYDQYRPARGSRETPRGRVGKLTALADRLDTLVALLVEGKLPAGGPARRRVEEEADAAIRILVSGRLAVDLDLAMARAVRRYGSRLGGRSTALLTELRGFLGERLRRILSEGGFADDELDAVLDASGSRLLPAVVSRLELIQSCRGDARFERSVRAARRLLQVIQEAPESRLERSLLTEPAEQKLMATLESSRRRVETSWQHDREEWLGALAELADALERFFAEVLVRDENDELRSNRLALLQAVQRVFSRQIRLAEITFTNPTQSSQGHP